MYPSLDNSNPMNNSIQFRKTLNPSNEITNAMLEIRNFCTISSFKPHLNYYECHLNLIVNNKVNYPLKIIFLRNFPNEKPIIYLQKWYVHPLVNQMTCEVMYDQKYPWSQAKSINQILKRIQGQFANNLPNQKTDIDMAIGQLDIYLQNVQSLRTKPPGTQPPPPPQINFQNVLKVFQFQQNLKTQCQERNSTYLFTAQQYSQNVSRVKCIGERFGKGKILKEMQKQLSSVMDEKGLKIDDQMRKYYENRKKYHRVKILKEKYLQS